jgi:hypothetical protein
MALTKGTLRTKSIVVQNMEIMAAIVKVIKSFKRFKTHYFQ